MLTRLRTFFKTYLSDAVIRQTYQKWRSDRTIRLGAGLAYYAMFAFIPVLTLMIAIAALIFSSDEIVSYLNEILIEIFGSELSTAINEVTDSVAELDQSGIVRSIGVIGVVSLFISASFIFVAFQDALDVIWKNPVRVGFERVAKKYVLAYGIVLLASSMLLAVLIMHTASSLATYLVPGEATLLDELADLFVSFATWGLGILTLAFVQKLLIRRETSWRLLIIGSTVTTLLIVVGTWLLGFYLSTLGGSSLGGAVGAVFLFLAWVYYEAQIMLAGAQYTYVLHQRAHHLTKNEAID